MEKMKKLVLIILSLVGFSCFTNSFASETQERLYLVQILNQLSAIQPFVIAAAKEQPKNLRTQFHYIRYQDAQGCWHNGLLEDIQSIKQGIKEKLHNTPVEPRVITPISGDYLERDNK